LIIARHGVKPALVMKTLSGRFWFVVFGIIVIVAVGSCCCTIPLIKDAHFVITDKKSFVELGQLRGIYVEWKSQHKFDEALKQVCEHHGTYCIYTDADPQHPYQPTNPASNCTNCSPKKIRTVKVTKSKAADKIAAGESVVNDPNVMHRVQSPDPGDIINVLNALKPAGP